MVSGEPQELRTAQKRPGLCHGPILGALNYNGAPPQPPSAPGQSARKSAMGADGEMFLSVCLPYGLNELASNMTVFFLLRKLLFLQSGAQKDCVTPVSLMRWVIFKLQSFYIHLITALYYILVDCIGFGM